MIIVLLSINLSLTRCIAVAGLIGLYQEALQNEESHQTGPLEKPELLNLFCHQNAVTFRPAEEPNLVDLEQPISPDIDAQISDNETPWRLSLQYSPASMVLHDFSSTSPP